MPDEQHENNQHLTRVFGTVNAIADALNRGEGLEKVAQAILKGVLSIFSEEHQADASSVCAASICAYDASRPDMFHFVHETHLHEGGHGAREYLEDPPRNGYTRDPHSQTRKAVGTEMALLKEWNLTLPDVKYIRDVVNHWPADLPKPKKPLEHSGVSSALYIPLQVGLRRYRQMKTVGMLTVFFSSPHDFTKKSAEEAELKLYAKMAASALYNEELIEKNELEEERLKELEDMIQTLEEGAPLREIAERAAAFALRGALEEPSARQEKRFTAHQCDFDCFVLSIPASVTGGKQEVFLARPEGDHVTITTPQPTDEELPLEYQERWFDAGYWDTPDHRRNLKKPDWLEALGYPLKGGDRELGVLYVTRSEEKARRVLGLERDQKIDEDVHPFLAEEYTLLADLAKEIAILIEDLDRQTRHAKKARMGSVLGQGLLRDAALSLRLPNPAAVRSAAWDVVFQQLSEHFSHEQFTVLELRDQTITHLKVWRGGRFRDPLNFPAYQQGARRDLANYVLSTGKTLFFPSNVEDSIRSQHLDASIDITTQLPLPYLGVPVKRGEQVYAMIEVAHSNEHGALQETDRGVVEDVAAWMALLYSAREGAGT